MTRSATWTIHCTPRWPKARRASMPALEAAIAPERTRFWQALRERAVQTNETTRAVTWLWPAALLAAAGERRAITLVDIGTSAGLNLTADALPPLWQDATGAAIAVAPRLEPALRLGFDIALVDGAAVAVLQRDFAAPSRLAIGESRV